MFDNPQPSRFERGGRAMNRKKGNKWWVSFLPQGDNFSYVDKRQFPFHL